MIARSAAIFPDLEATVEDIFAEGEKVAVRWTFRSTYQGETKPGFPKPGERCTLVAISTYRFANGKIEDDWGLTRSGRERRLGNDSCCVAKLPIELH